MPGWRSGLGMSTNSPTAGPSPKPDLLCDSANCVPDGFESFDWSLCCMISSHFCITYAVFQLFPVQSEVCQAHSSQIECLHGFN